MPYNIMQKQEKTTIHAMLKKNLRSYLKSVGLWSDLETGRLNCKICADNLTLDNIGAIYFRDNRPILSCKKPSCYHNMHVRNNT